MTNHAQPREQASPLKIAVISTCPPRQCGIATFASDLARAIEAADPTTHVSWAAIDEGHSSREYGSQVQWRIDQHTPASYQRVATALNASDIDIVSVQHEFGLYGEWGDTFKDHLAPFLSVLRKPLVTTLHTVPPAPSPSVRDAVRRIGTHSSAVVVMAQTARGILERDYGLDPAKIQVIPHGAPPVALGNHNQMKEQLGLAGRSVISTFGLLDPRKGIEYMVRAMPEIVRRHPDALYLILGKTHPDLVRQKGEAYRAELTALAHECGVDDHVAFVDEYLSQGEIVDYLVASDLYVTPYLDLGQITSGTLAYALGAGKAIVSTPYAHAVEALANERGIVVGARNPQALSDAACNVLGDQQLRQRLERNAYTYGRLTAWPNIGRQVVQLYRAVAAPRIVVPAWVAAGTLAGRIDAAHSPQRVPRDRDAVLTVERDR